MAQVMSYDNQKINFPPACAKKQWEALDSKIVLQLDKLIGKSTLGHKLTTSGDIIYQTCLNTFRAKQHQATREPKKSRRQREMETVRKQKKNLRKQMKSATEEEKKWAAGTLARFEGETLSTEQSRNRKEETKSKEKELGTLLQRPISVCKTTLSATKIRFPFGTARTAGDPPEENIF